MLKNYVVVIAFACLYVFIQWANSQITAAIWELFRTILCLLTSRTAKDKQGQKINEWTPHRSKGKTDVPREKNSRATTKPQDRN